MLEPRTLLIETSGKVGAVALAEGSVVLCRHHLDEARRHARDLAPGIAALLRERAWKPGEVQAVIVSRGPGSYTGLRVGLMTAKTFAWATGCALLAIDTFAILAAQTPDTLSRVDVLGDAQQDKVYAQSFTHTPTGWQGNTLTIERFADFASRREAGVRVTGPGVSKWREQLGTDAHVDDPTVEALLALGLDRYLQGQRDDPFAIEPLYLRPSSAEEQWRGRS